MNLIIDNKVFEMYYLGTLTASTQVEQRGVSMGIELDTITRGLGTRIPVIIKEGKRRPRHLCKLQSWLLRVGSYSGSIYPYIQVGKNTRRTNTNWTTSLAN